jgi:hypothetical protein
LTLATEKYNIPATTVDNDGLENIETIKLKVFGTVEELKMAKVTPVLRDIDDYLNQFGPHNEFDENGRLISTTYWESEGCKNGAFFLAFNKGIYSLLVPEQGKAMLDGLKSLYPLSVVISCGVYNGKPGAYEIMFDDGSGTPYRLQLGGNQVLPAPEGSDTGWKGSFYIYADGLDEFSAYFRNVYFRIVDTLPCMMAPEEPPPESKPAMKIDKVEHFEGHGDKWNALGFEGADEEFAALLQNSVQHGSLLKRFSLEDASKKGAGIFALVYPEEGPVRSCALIAPREGKLSLETMFPLLEGIENNVTVRSKYTWENGIEGEVEIDINGFDSFVFTPFYKQDYESVEDSTTVKMSLAGLAYTVQNAMMSFEIGEGPMYEQQLSDFLQKNPGKTRKDFPNLEIHMDGLVATFPTETHSEYQYRGTILALEYTEFFGRKIAKTKVCIKRDEDGEQLHIYLYIPLNRCGNCELAVGKDIQGIIWLQGYGVE